MTSDPRVPAPNALWDATNAWEQALLPIVLDRMRFDAATAALVVQCRGGGAIVELQRAAPELARIMATDADPEQVAQARRRTAGRQPRVHVALRTIDALSFGDNVFSHVVAIHDLATRGAVQQLLARCSSFVAPKGWIAVASVSPPGLQTWTDVMTEVAAADGADGLVDDVHAALWQGDAPSESLDALGLQWVDQGVCEVRIEAEDPNAYLASRGSRTDRRCVAWRRRSGTHRAGRASAPDILCWPCTERYRTGALGNRPRRRGVLRCPRRRCDRSLGLADAPRALTP